MALKQHLLKKRWRVKHSRIQLTSMKMVVGSIFQWIQLQDGKRDANWLLFFLGLVQPTSSVSLTSVSQVSTTCVALEERGRHKCQCRCLVIDLHVVPLRSLSHWKTMQLLPVKTWVIQLSQPGPSASMKGIEILKSPWCILILAIVQPTEIKFSFTISPTCAYYSYQHLM